LNELLGAGPGLYLNIPDKRLEAITAGLDNGDCEMTRLAHIEIARYSRFSFVSSAGHKDAITVFQSRLIVWANA
jgi:hypothetical protein